MPPRLFTKVGSFEQSSGSHLVRVFRFRSQPADESNFGKLFGLGEGSGAFGVAAISRIQNTLGEYYNPVARSRWARGRTLSVESLFEELLHEANENWAEQPGGETENIHVAIGLQKDNTLYLAGHGALRALLFRERGGGYFQHFDLLRLKNDPNQKEAGLFSHVISGELLIGDAIVLLSQKFLEKMTLREVERALALNPQAGAAFLQDNLDEDASHTPLGALILRRSAEDVAPVRLKSVRGAQSSVETLRVTEAKTEQVLAPQILPSFKEFLASITLRRPHTRRHSSFYGRKNQKFSKTRRRLGRAIINVVNAIVSTMGSVLEFIFVVATNWRGQRGQIWGGIKQTFKKIAEKTIASFNLLPRRSKNLLFVGLTLIFIFTQSAMLVARRNYATERERVWQELYNNLAAKREEIESSLIYGDEEHARTLLLEAEREFEVMAKDAGPHEEEIKKLKTLLDQTTFRVNHIILIENPHNLINLPPEVHAEFIAVNKKNILIASTGGGLIKIKFENKSMETQPPAPAPGGQLVFAQEGTAILALSSDNASIFSEENWAAKFIERKARASLDEAAAYGDRLYILDKEKDNIWRYDKVEGGYGNEVSWLRERYELQSISSFTIDNSLYLLDKFGTIRKFHRGREQEFRVTALVPAFGNTNQLIASANEEAKPGKIKTSSESDFLYVLDPSGARAVVYAKGGKLVAQYTSPKFDDLRDLAFDEKKKELYLLNGNSVFTILAVHLDKKQP